MKYLTLIRHTKPAIPLGVCYGQLDVDLDESFVAEAKDISRCISAPELIITSPLLRSRRLAEYLAIEHGCELRARVELKEMNFGNWEGQFWNDITRDEIDAWNADVLNYIPPNGESALQMQQRVITLMQELAEYKQQHIVIVAHGGSIRAALAHLGNIPLSATLNWQIDFGSVITAR